MPKPLTVWITTNWKILKEMGMPDHLTCFLKNLYAGQEATVRTGHGTTDWKWSVFIPMPKKVNAKNVQTTTQLYSAHMLAE